jgi:ADP-heptose:LPS heptosyltransferase
MMREYAGKMKKVLAVNIGGIGDMVLATPALECLAEHVDGGILDILTVKRSAPVVEEAPFVGRLFAVDVSALAGRPSIGGGIRFASSLAALLRLRSARYDLAVDLMAIESPRASARRKILFSIVGPKRTAGRNTNGWAGWLDTRAPETLISPVHEVDRKLSVLDALGIDANTRPMRVYSTDRDAAEADSVLKKIGGAEGEVAVLVPGAWQPTRRWDSAGFAAVGRHLNRRWGLQVAVCGTSDEHMTVASVADAVGGAFVLLDVAPRVLFEIFNRCAIIVTNDTGPMHLAAAGRPRVVAIFSQDPDRYAPRQPDRIIVLSHPVDCAPCTKYECPDMFCFDGIDVDAVTGAVDSLMGRPL